MKKIILITLGFLLIIACRAEAVVRIVSLAPNTTEILFKLGLGGSIVGVDDFSNYPEKARGIERLGAFNNTDIERLILLKPDYILVNSGLGAEKEDYLNGLGIKVIRVSPKTMEGLFDDIMRLGMIFDKEGKAKEIVMDMRSRIDDVAMMQNGPRPKVFVQLFDDPLVTVSSFISDVIRLAGGENIAQDVKDDSGIFSLESLIDRDPDIILALGFYRDAGNFQTVKAVKNKKVYRGLDPDLILRPGPRAIEAVERLNRIFYE